jgi:murein DD-endopeptidase MepM/ murein hydrolase activator NlpD
VTTKMALREKAVLGGFIGVLMLSPQLSVAALEGNSTVQTAEQSVKMVMPIKPLELAAEFVGVQPPPARAAEEAAEPVSRAAPQWGPVTTGRITSGFGPRWGTMLKGVDIANKVGTPIRAASSGEVISSGPARGYGMWVRIAHPGNVVTIYGHINKSFVSVGQHVEVGQVIAEMGDRGQSTGPHLHFQIEVNGEAVDPVQFYERAGAELTW